MQTIFHIHNDEKNNLEGAQQVTFKSYISARHNFEGLFSLSLPEQVF